MRKTICLCALLISLAGIFSCKKKEFGKLEVRFHHFAPNTGLLSWVYAGKDTVARISYTESSPYIVAGLENLSFNAFSDKQLRVRVSNPAWQQDSKYSVYVCDTPGTINKILIKDEQIPASTGKAYLRFIHLMPDTHAVQLMANDSVLFKSERFVYALRNYFKGISGYDT
ncbi:MAG: DUF4397 domain-containing protein, partial [Chitinophagales bacterium]|nr:DUF4397 domain-containing protein [Chitinophagales bacterium]